LEKAGWAPSVAADHWIGGVMVAGSVGHGALGVVVIFLAGLAFIRLDMVEKQKLVKAEPRLVPNLDLAEEET
jgi:hypothetical protein